jgi:hypothetical protein
MLDLGLTWDLAKQQCGGDGVEKTYAIQENDPALPWAGLHDIVKKLRHRLAQGVCSQLTNPFGVGVEDLFLAAIEEGLRFGDKGEFSGPDNFCCNSMSSDKRDEEVRLSRKLHDKLMKEVSRLSLEINIDGIGSTTMEDELIFNALQVGLREDSFPILRAYIGSTGAALATETPIDSDFGELNMTRIAEASPKEKLGSSYISGVGLSRMSMDKLERIGLEKIPSARGLRQRVILVKTGLDENQAYAEYAVPTLNGGWQVNSSKLSLIKTAGSRGDWRDRWRFFYPWNYPFIEYLERWPDDLTSEPSGSTKGTTKLTPKEMQVCRERRQGVDLEVTPHLPRAWDAIRAYYKKLRELRGLKSSRPAET